MAAKRAASFRLTPAAARPLSLSTILAFCATSVPITALVVAITVHMPAYFAASIGVPLSATKGSTAMALGEPVGPMMAST